MRRKYTTVKIPVELSDELDKLEEAQGYSSRAEVVDDAIRRFIESRHSIPFGSEKIEEDKPTKSQMHAPMISR